MLIKIILRYLYVDSILKMVKKKTQMLTMRSALLDIINMLILQERDDYDEKIN